MDVRIQIFDEGVDIDHTINLVECWDDVPADIYPHLASLYLSPHLDKYERSVQAFGLLTASSFSYIEQLPAADLYDLLSLVNWVFDRLDLEKNLLPVIRIGEVDYLGPADELENLRFAEWCAADTFYVNYAQDPDPEQLHKLAAVLYRPAGTGPEYMPGNVAYRGDIREKFNENLLPDRTALMAAQPDHIIKGIYLFYASCRHEILKMYPNTFPVDKKAKEDNSNSGWLDIYDDLRSDNKYIGADRLDEEMLHSVLFSLERSNIKMKKLKKDYDL